MGRVLGFVQEVLGLNPHQTVNIVPLHMGLKTCLRITNACLRPKLEIYWHSC